MPAKASMRASTDRVREAICCVLADRVNEAVYLDLFCGSGSLGLEALSRGADRVVFADRTIDCLKAVEASLTGLGFNTRIVEKGIPLFE